MPPRPAFARKPTLALVVQSGDFERVHYALVMAAAAAAIDRPVVLFFTLEASRALLARKSETGPESAPGWAALRTTDGRDGGAVDAERIGRGVAGFEELLAAAAELRIPVMVCEMGLRALGLEARQLRRDIAIEISGFVTFLERAGADGQIVFV